jgi:hypothetical protein
MDIVYPLGTGSVWDNNELRYSLRSVEENLTNVRYIWVIGERPEWLTGVRHIPYPDITGVPWRNSFAKLVRACIEPDLSSNFLYMNDDFFILKPFAIEKFPILYRGNLPAGAVKSRVMSLNRKQNTTTLLLSKKLTTLDYDLHAPFIFEKQKVLDLPMSPSMPGAFHPRSFYGNYYNVRGQQRDEILVNPGRDLDKLKEYLSDKEYCAIMTHAGKDWRVRQYFKQRFPKKSRFELSTE